MNRRQDDFHPLRHVHRAWVGAILVASIVAYAAGDAPTTEPALKVITLGPVEYRLIVQQKPPQRLHVMTVDLTDTRVSLRVCRGGADPDANGVWETTLATVKDIAEREKLIAAVNGSMFSTKDTMKVADLHDPYFTGNWARSLGWTMSDGELWATHPLSWDAPCLVVSGDRDVRIGVFKQPPDDARQIVPGFQYLVHGGKNVAGTDPRTDPRSAVGIAKDGKELVMLVVDGGRPDEAVGFTLAQMADEMMRMGCSEAIGLDGGGSSTMVLCPTRGDWEVMNQPSDGDKLIVPLSVTRPVACALGVVLRDGPDTRPADAK